jgi:hypothetical protein
MWSPTFANMTPPINDFDTNGLRRQLVQRKGQKSRLRKGQFQRLPGLRGSSPSAPNAANSRGADIDIVSPEGMPDHRLVEGELDLKLWILHRWKGTPINAAPDEHETIGWFAFSEARALELAHESYFNLIERISRSNPRNLQQRRRADPHDVRLEDQVLVCA